MGWNRDRTLWTLAALTGVAAGAWLWRSAIGRRPTRESPTAAVEGNSALRVARALDDDIELAAFDLVVNRISDGVIELIGAVGDTEQRQRAIALAHAVDGVHTVVNRLVLEGEEARLRANRTRNADRRLQHTGMGVGMGTRRQSPDTDPDRPSDRQRRVERALEVGNMEATPPAPGAPDVADSGVAEEPPS